MPHREVRGPVSLRAVHETFARHTYREGQLVLKVEGCYLSHDEETLLFDCLAVESHLRQGYFVLCARKGDSIMVRLLPRTSPEKTDGVKRSIAWVSHWIRSSAADGTYGASNLEAHLVGEFPQESLPDNLG